MWQMNTISKQIVQVSWPQFICMETYFTSVEGERGKNDDSSHIWSINISQFGYSKRLQ